MKFNNPIFLSLSLILNITAVQNTQADLLDFADTAANQSANLKAGAAASVVSPAGQVQLNAATQAQAAAKELANTKAAANAAAETAANVKANTANAIGTAVSQSATAQAVSQGNLTSILMQNTGVSQVQAEGGAGAMFQIAKARMEQQAFAELSQSIPGMGTYLAAAPQQAGSVGGLTGGLLNSIPGNVGGSAATLLSAFQQLNMSQQQLSQFTPLLIDYVKQHANPQVSVALQAALTASAN